MHCLNTCIIHCFQLRTFTISDVFVLAGIYIRAVRSDLGLDSLQWKFVFLSP